MTVNEILRTGSTSDPDEKLARQTIKTLDGAKDCAKRKHNTVPWWSVR